MACALSRRGAVESARERTAHPFALRTAPEEPLDPAEQQRLTVDGQAFPFLQLRRHRPPPVRVTRRLAMHDNSRYPAPQNALYLRRDDTVANLRYWGLLGAPLLPNWLSPADNVTDDRVTVERNPSGHLYITVAR